MLPQRMFRLALAFAGALLLLAPAPVLVSAQQKSDKKKEPPPQGTPVMWREHADVSALNMLDGPGGAAMRPDTSRLTFIRMENQGYSTKYRVRDAAGRVWVAKVGVEAQPETAAMRLVWAAGYATEINYLVPRATIDGKGTFENVRFEARPDNMRRLDIWSWAANPFTGKREMQGLKVLMAMIENWDLKDENNKVVYVPTEAGATDATAAGGSTTEGAAATTTAPTGELRYIISDLGATFGKTGGQGGFMSSLRNIKGSRNKPKDYVGDKFVEGVEGGKVRLHFSGKLSELMRDISVEDAKWVGTLLSRLSDEQIADMFRAANYTPEEVKMLTGAVRGRINQLVNL